ncbi:MAG: helicase HerA-like domain-containing protein [Fimbriimonadales bacterium]
MSLIAFLESLAIAAINRTGKLPRRGDSPDHSAVCIGTALDFDESPLSEGELVFLKEEDRQRHTYIIGATGSGKSSLLVQLIESDIKSGKSVVVLDMRGDLVGKLLARIAGMPNREIQPDRIELIDLRDDSFVPVFNPLAGSTEPHSRAQAVLDVIRSQSPSWGVQLEETLRHALVSLAESGGALTDVERMLVNANFRERVLTIVTDQSALDFFERYGELSPEKQMSWYLPVLNKLTPLFALPVMRRLLGRGESIKISKLLDQPGKIVLISLGYERLHSAALLVGGLLVAAIQGGVFARTAIPEQGRNPVSMYVDEFENLASSAFEQVIAEGRRFKLSLTLSHQNVAQLPTKLHQCIRNNVYTQIYFQTGAIDAAELSKEIVVSASKDDLRQMLIGQAVGEAFLLRRGQPPLRFRAKRLEKSAVTDEQLNTLMTCLRRQVSGTSKNSGTPMPTEPFKLEVRHDRLPRLR